MEGGLKEARNGGKSVGQALEKDLVEKNEFGGRTEQADKGVEQKNN